MSKVPYPPEFNIGKIEQPKLEKGITEQEYCINSATIRGTLVAIDYSIQQNLEDSCRVDHVSESIFLEELKEFINQQGLRTRKKANPVHHEEQAQDYIELPMEEYLDQCLAEAAGAYLEARKEEKHDYQGHQR